MTQRSESTRAPAERAPTSADRWRPPSLVNFDSRYPYGAPRAPIAPRAPVAPVAPAPPRGDRDVKPDNVVLPREPTPPRAPSPPTPPRAPRPPREARVPMPPREPTPPRPPAVAASPRAPQAVAPAPAAAPLVEISARPETDAAPPLALAVPPDRPIARAGEGAKRDGEWVITPMPKPVRAISAARVDDATLIKWYIEGDNAAGAALCAKHAGLIFAYAKKQLHGSVEVEDLLQEANMGFLEGVRRYDAESGYKLMTYASWWVRHFARKYRVNHGSVIRVPVNAQEGRGKRYLLLARLAGTVLRLDALIEGDSSRTLGEELADDAPSAEALILDREAHLSVDEVLRRAGLSPREEELARRRLLADEPETLAQIGESWSRTRECVRQVEVKTLAKLRSAFARLLQVEGVFDGTMPDLALASPGDGENIAT